RNMSYNNKLLLILRQGGYYAQNGRYYTLPDIAIFGEYGLWRYKGVFFSRHGSLKQTIIVLVDNSPAGLTVAEAGQIVGMFLSSFMGQS
ncbi:MAG: hypothetical protein AAB110_10050, partial [Candidatus Desantisbacteria bacterium]